MVFFLLGLTLLILLVLLRAIIGPTVIDRLISINAITGKVSVAILLLAFSREKYGFVDIAIVFMLCGFAGSLWIIRALTPGDWQLKLPGAKGQQADQEKGDVVSND